MSEQVKPVAYRVKDFADGWFYYDRQTQLAEVTRAEVDGFLVQPLYLEAPTSPPPVSREDRLPSVEEVARMIKPSAWRDLEGRWEDDSRWLSEDHRKAVLSKRQVYALSKASAILGMVGGGSSNASRAAMGPVAHVAPEAEPSGPCPSCGSWLHGVE